MTSKTPLKPTCDLSHPLAPLAVLLALCILGMLGAVPAEAMPPNPAPLHSCQPEGFEEEVLCGTIEVPENPERPDGRQIGMNVMVLPAIGPNPAPEPLFIFNGGPGEGVVDGAPYIAKTAAAVREVRDILLVDIRGTGESNPLRCPYQDEADYLSDFAPPAGVVECVETLGETADLTFYTTPYIVDDIDRVREILGYERLVLSGGSYGTRASLVYMRRHPTHVAAADLQGIAPVDGKIPQDFAQDAQRALDGVIDDCAADDDCRKAFPRLRTELWQVIERFETEGPLLATVPDPRSGGDLEVKVDHKVFAQSLRYMLYQPSLGYQIPLAIHQAAIEGDASIFAGVAVNFGQALAGAVADGIYLAVTCAEDVPWIDPEDAIESAAGTFLGEYRYRAQTTACALWPRGKLPGGYEQYTKPTVSDVPVLILSGQFDPVTPPYLGARVARNLPNSLHLVVPHGGHGYGGLQGIDCVRAIRETFLINLSFDGVDTSCMGDIKRGAFALEGEPESISLPPEALEPFVGTYKDEEGMTVSFVAEDGALKAEIPGQNPFRLEPLSEIRFKILGAPVGFYISFDVEDGEVTGFTLEQGSGEPVTFERIGG